MYYPDGYIDDSMWNLSHQGYEDNVIEKGNPYHYDNCLPGLDVGPP